MRSSIGGWVLNRLLKFPPFSPASGFTMYMCAVDGFTCIGRIIAPCCSLASASASASGSCVVFAPVLSASYSRVREIDICTMLAAIGIRMMAASAEQRRSPSPPTPPNIMPHIMLVVIHEMAPAKTAAIDADEDVAVADVPQLVGHDALQLAVVEQVHDARRRGDDGVLRVAARREGVRRRVVDEVDLRLRQRRQRQHFIDDAVQARRLLRRDFVRAGHAQRQLVADPVGEEVHDRRRSRRR